MYLIAAGAIFSEKTFKYTKEVVQGLYATLEFELEMDGIIVNGIDQLTFNENGKMTEFKVFIRPLKAVNLIHQLML